MKTFVSRRFRKITIWSIMTKMEEYLEQFLNYLEKDKKMSGNTIQAYKRDIISLSEFLKSRGDTAIKDTTNADVVAYLIQLKKNGKSAATVNRKIASLRAFFSYMVKQHLIQANPTDSIRSPRIERTEPEFLTIEEVDKFLSIPDDTAKGRRDKAILELLYATGIRVSEAIEANIEDINLRMGFISCDGQHGKARIIPIGRPARVALEEYIYDIRPQFVREKLDEKALFVNYRGERITRQGLWKLIREYAKKAGIESKITPQTLRNSFAVHMIQNGADLKSLQELLGHEDISATQIYLSVTKNRIKDVYDRTHPRA